MPLMPRVVQEFQKRQLRIREKVAAMQKSKLGYVDPQLSAAWFAEISRVCIEVTNFTTLAFLCFSELFLRNLFLCTTPEAKIPAAALGACFREAKAVTWCDCTRG